MDWNLNMTHMDNASLAVIIIIVLIVIVWFVVTYSRTFKHDSSKLQQMLRDFDRIRNGNSYLARSTIIEAMSGYQGADTTEQRWQQNNHELARIYSEISGNEAGKKYYELLNREKKLTLDMASSAHKGLNTNGAKQKIQQLIDDTIEIVRQDCPSVSASELRDQLTKSFDKLSHYANYLAKKDYGSSITQFTEYLHENDKVGDILEQGLQHAAAPSMA